jgi:hypothetical protein
MNISDGQSRKKLALYSPVQLLPDLSQPIWPELDEETEETNLLA